jgi:dihydroneopterin aldolase
MDKILLNGLEFYGYHGCLPEENKLGQKFIVDVEIKADLRQAGETDELEHTINYAEVYDICKEYAEQRASKLLENVAENIANTILDTFLIAKSCKVKIVKPNPPIQGYYNNVGIVIKRSKK